MTSVNKLNTVGMMQCHLQLLCLHSGKKSKEIPATRPDRGITCRSTGVPQLTASLRPRSWDKATWVLQPQPQARLIPWGREERAAPADPCLDSLTLRPVTQEDNSCLKPLHSGMDRYAAMEKSVSSSNRDIGGFLRH